MNIVEMLKNQGFNVIETEHGIFTNNEATGETVEEVYERYLASKDKQIDICTPKTNQELQEEIENLKAQLESVHERLCTQQEMSATVIASIFGNEVLKNE